MRVVVVGASEFIGSCIVEEMIRHDIEVVALATESFRLNYLKEQGVEVVEGSLDSINFLREIFSGASCVVYSHSYPNVEDVGFTSSKVNIEDTTNVLDACLDNGIQGVLYISSTLPYGNGLPHRPVDESWTFRPSSKTEQSYAIAERAARTYRNRLPLVVLRPSLLFGPGDMGTGYALLSHFRKVKRPVLIGDGRAVVSLTYGPDLARVVWMILEQLNELKDPIFHVKTIDTNWRTVLGETQTIVHHDPAVISFPYRVALAMERIPLINEWLKTNCARIPSYPSLISEPHWIDDSKLRIATGFTPLFGLRAALRQTLDWIDTSMN